MESVQFPRRAYFGAIDRTPLDPNPSAASVSAQQVAIAKRNSLAQTAIYRAEQVAAAVKTARTYDTTGNLPAALPHLAVCLEDLTAGIEELTADIRKSLDRCARRQRMNAGLDVAAAAEAEAGARAADAQLQGPAPAIGRDVDAAVLAECIEAGGQPAAELAELAPKPGQFRKLADRPQA